MKGVLSFTLASALLYRLVGALPAGSAGQVDTPTKPDDTDPNEAPDCDLWYIADADGSTCYSISQNSGVSLSVIFKLNPALKANCFDVTAGRGYCIHASGSGSTDTTTKSTITTTTTTVPTTTQRPVTTTTIKPTTTTTTKVTTTTTTTNTDPDPTFVPDQFPPKKGQLAQCVPDFPNDTFPNGHLQPYMIWGDDLTKGVQDACAKIIPGGSKWLEKGNAYTVSVPIMGRTMYFHMKIWLGGFSVPVDSCVKQINSVFSHCSIGTPWGSEGFGGTLGGCGYSDDLNLQACFFPTRICDPSLPVGACDQ
ncbi:hypothetical protein TWF694_006135 [Orbilia ellipsospora]|uniref:LysM domain-containing protein n=1 Tax=Orbilia ellipsospora TaxID=2528407 RepID=A0AAV9WRB9_9PEZI